MNGAAAEEKKGSNNNRLDKEEEESVSTHLSTGKSGKKKRSRSLKNVNRNSYGSIGFKDGGSRSSNDNASVARMDQSASLLNYYSEEITPSAREHDGPVEEPQVVVVPNTAASSAGKCKYVIEPMVFLQSMASSIIGVAYGQFVYNRILDRLIEESRTNGTNMTTLHYTAAAYYTEPSGNTTTMSTSTLPTTTAEPYNPSQYCNTSHVHSHNLTRLAPTNYLANIIITLVTYSMNLSPTFTFPFLGAIQGTRFPHELGGFIPSNYDEIRVRAQEETADLFFKCGICGGIPVILMSNLLGVNCSYLGRKFLIILTQLGFILRFTILLLQCLYPEWPDWVYYAAAGIEGFSGSTSVFYMAIHCTLADTTSPKSRSYRLVLVNYIGSVSSLSVTFLCGYIIKYYGYLYLFIASLALSVVAFLYTLLFITESLVELRNKSIYQRIKSCSLSNIVNSVKVYAPREPKAPRRRSTYDDDASADETDNLLNDSKHGSSVDGMEEEEAEEFTKTRRQSYVLILIVFANFLYNFSGNGLNSIFTLFIMNEPFCFDSIAISNYSLFATVVSLTMSLVVSKFIKCNDLLICIFSVLSHFCNVFCYIYGKTPFLIYLGAVIGCISGLEYGYARSIISKSFKKEEVPDALSLIVTIDTFIGVVSVIIFPVMYAKLVSSGVEILFYICEGVILMVLLCHM